MSKICTVKNRQENKDKQNKYGPSSCRLFVILPLLALSFQAFIKCTISTVQTFQDSAYRITLSQLMICKIQLTVCKHKKAVGNEKKSKNKQNRQSIHGSMTFDYHCYYDYSS